jgi:hypothetical protein
MEAKRSNAERLAWVPPSPLQDATPGDLTLLASAAGKGVQRERGRGGGDHDEDGRPRQGRRRAQCGCGHAVRRLPNRWLYSESGPLVSAYIARITVVFPIPSKGLEVDRVNGWR